MSDVIRGTANFSFIEFTNQGSEGRKPLVFTYKKLVNQPVEVKTGKKVKTEMEEAEVEHQMILVFAFKKDDRGNCGTVQVFDSKDSGKKFLLYMQGTSCTLEEHNKVFSHPFFSSRSKKNDRTSAY